jgi:hypothetical protein
MLIVWIDQDDIRFSIGLPEKVLDQEFRFLLKPQTTI